MDALTEQRIHGRPRTSTAAQSEDNSLHLTGSFERGQTPHAVTCPTAKIARAQSRRSSTRPRHWQRCHRHPRFSAHPRRERDRQHRDGRREGSAGPEPPVGGPVRRDQLRGHPRDPVRGRAVRLREKGLHRREVSEARARGGGRRRHAVPRRDRPHGHGAPSEAAQGHRGEVRPPGGGAPEQERERPHPRRYEPRPGRGGGGRRVPRRPLLSHQAEAALSGYAWPGNVRELAHVMERAALLGRGSRIGAEELACPPRTPRVR